MSNGRLYLITLFLVCLCVPGYGCLEQGQPPVLSPAHMGPNSLPIQRAGYSHIGNESKLSLSIENHYQANEEHTLNPKIEGFVPLGVHVALRLLVRPFEYFYTSKKRQQSRYACSQEGVSKGDLYYGMTFGLLKEGSSPFNLALNVLTKTTTGKNLEQARYTNAPGYHLDVSADRSFKDFGVFEKLTVGGYVSFFAWQSRFNQQNDAAGYALLLEFYQDLWSMELEFSGYYGWQNNGDRPQNVRLGLGYEMDIGELYGLYSYNLRDLPTPTLEIGFKWKLASLVADISE